MTDALSKLLASREWLMADGATGTNLFNMGLESGEPPEFWNTDRPDNIRTLYRGAVEAGSDLFLTNTFGGNAARLKLHGAQGRVRELNRLAASIGREVADKAGRTVVVAGSMGPTGEIFEPMGTLTHAMAVEIFHEQAEGLKAGGADVLWVETISAPEEYRAAAEAAALAGMPYSRAWDAYLDRETWAQAERQPAGGRPRPPPCADAGRGNRHWRSGSLADRGAHEGRGYRQP